MEKEKMWKDITDSLPEGVLIMNKKLKPSYCSNILRGYLNMLDIDIQSIQHIQKKQDHQKGKKKMSLIQEKKIDDEDLSSFFYKVINLKLRNSLEDLKARYKKSLSIFRKTNKYGDSYIKEDILESVIDKEVNKYPPLIEWLTLNDFIKFTNQTSDSQYIFSLDDFITFDGSFQEKSLEIKVKNIQLEGELVLLMIFVDTTHRDLIARLEQNDKYKNIVLSTVSHELRTPLNSAISMIQTAIDITDISQLYKNELLHPSLRSLNMLASLINDILDYSQIQANKLNLVFQNVDLRQVIYDACALFDIQCKKKGIKLIIDIPEEVPSFIRTDPNRLTQIILNLLSNAIKFTKKGYVKISIKWDDFKYGKAIIAIEDTGIGIKPEEQCKLFREYGKIDLGENAKMNPTGCGLGFSISHKLAMRLGGGDSGGIKVESQVNKGSIFSFSVEDKQDSKILMGTESVLDLNLRLDNCDIQTFSQMKSSLISWKQMENGNTSFITLPKKPRRRMSKKEDDQDFNVQLELEEGNQKKLLNPKPKKFMKADDLINDKSSPNISNRPLLPDISQVTICCDRWNILSNKPKLLIIDDDIINLHSFTLITKYLNYECNAANSVEEGLKLLKKDNLCKMHAPYDIIFMDFNMPDIDGLTATKTIKNMILRGELPSISIIGCTAFLNEAIEKKGIEAEMDYIIEKPITKEKLVNIVKMFEKNI